MLLSSRGCRGSPMLPLQSVTNWGDAKKLALQSVTKGGVTAMSEGYVIYGRSLIPKAVKKVVTTYALSLSSWNEKCVFLKPYGW